MDNTNKEIRFESYPVTVFFPVDKEDKVFFVEIEDLNGCWASGGTLKQALKRLKQSFDVWMDDTIKKNYSVPSPSDFRVENAPMRFIIPMERELAAKLCEQPGHPNDFIIQVIKEKLENLS